MLFTQAHTILKIFYRRVDRADMGAGTIVLKSTANRKVDERTDRASSAANGYCLAKQLDDNP